MLVNNKCILAYGLNDEEIKDLTNSDFDIIVVNKEMLDIKVRDILNGVNLETVTAEYPKEKIIVFNNYEDNKLQSSVKLVRSIVKGVILAAVTPTSREWTFKYLTKHLIEERNYLKGKQKER